MFKTLLKWLARTISLIGITLLVAVLLFRFQPQIYLKAVNHFTAYEVKASEVQIKLIPLSSEFTKLTVNHKPSDTQQLELERLFARLSWKGLLSKHNNFWYAELGNGQVNVSAISNSTNNSTSNQSNAGRASESINIHRLLSLLNLKLKNIEVEITPNTIVDITELNTHLDSEEHLRPEQVKQNISLNILYKESGKQLAIGGTLDSAVSDNGVNQLNLALDELDLTSLLSSKAQQNPNDAPESTDQPSTEPRAIDWSWLDSLKKTNINISLKRLAIGDNTLDQLALDALLDKEIVINHLSTDVSWALQSDINLVDKISLTGRLSPMDDGQIKTQLALGLNGHTVRDMSASNTAKLSSDSSENKQENSATSTATPANKDFINITGTISPLNPEKSVLTLSSQLSRIPLFNKEGKTLSLIQDYAQFLPLAINTEYQLSKEAYKLSNLSLTAGKSDLSGSLHIQLNDKTPRIRAEVQSDRMVYLSPKQATTNSNRPPENTNEKLETVFPRHNLDWSWLNAMEIDASYKAKQLRLDDYQFQKVNLPVELAGGNLHIKKFAAEFGQSPLNATINVHKQGQQAALQANIDADNIALSALNLIDKKHIEGGSLTSSIDVHSKGSSLYDLASGLNGHVLLTAKDAVIGNDVFELIGSDLVSEVLSKLNPFAKSNPTTELKCAVINLPIKDGLIDINNTIALQTSKVIIVADGKIDLKKETLILNLKPTAASGVGINAGSLVKFITLGGKLNAPQPIVSTKGLVKTSVAIGAAISTGGATIIADGLLSQAVGQNACQTALASR
ncbi:MAG: AsmA family protein [Arenicella sp.]